MESIIGFLIIGALFYFMMRFGCGAHIGGHGGGHEGHGRIEEEAPTSSSRVKESVCRMEIDKDRAVAMIRRDGRQIYFSSENCKISSMKSRRNTFNMHMQKINAAVLFSLLFLGIYYISSAMGAEEFHVSPPPMTEGIFPCSNCHTSMKVNRKKRGLKDEHTNIKLHHAETMRWCLDCHDAKNRDKLRLYTGELINFTESYRLCGECHGTLYRDWKAGIHGKRTGYFARGKRTYFLCANCHDPHEPKFKPMKPEPPPLGPALGIRE